MDSKIIVGIDCGIGGGIAYYIPEKKEVYAIPMPEKISDIDDALSFVLSNSIVYVEDVPPFVGINRPAARIFKLAKNYGIILGILEALCMEYITVRPAVWMKAIGTNKKKHYKTDNEWKNYLKKLAMIYYPNYINKHGNTKITLKTADALLILEYGMQQYFNREVAND